MDSGGSLAERLRATIRDVPDFPRAGIVFKDLTTVFGDAEMFRASIDAFTESFAGQSVDMVVGIESRGFIIGGALALRLGAGFVPVRKRGKLPAQTIAVAYALEYGEATLEIHRDALRPGQRVLIVDDLLATGGTAAAAVSLVRRLEGEVVGVAFVVELESLGGAAALRSVPHMSLVRL